MQKDRRNFVERLTRILAGATMLPSFLRRNSRAESLAVPPAATGSTYYIDTQGSNENSGNSMTQAWKDFSRINAMTLTPGDSVLLKRGCVWNEELKIKGQGTSGHFITVAAYGTGNRPKIQRNGKPSERCLRIQSPAYVKLSSIEVCNAGAGIFLFYDHSYNNRSVYLDDIVAHDFKGLPPEGQADRVTWSYGIGVTGVEDTPNNATRVLSDLRITNSEVYNTGAGIALDWGNHFCVDGTLALHNKFGDVLMEGLNLHDNTVDPVSFVSLFITSVTECTIRNSKIDKGCKYASSGTAALQIMYSKNVIVQNVTITNTPFNSCPDNTAIDFECRNENVVIDGCHFENNAGSAIEFLATPGNDDPYTRNFVIRNCTFIKNNWAHKNGNTQISVLDWDHGNTPTGQIANNKYINAPTTRFFGGDGNTTQIKLSGNTNIGPADPVARVVKSWNFKTTGGAAGWRAGAGIAQLRHRGGYLEGTMSSSDPSIMSPERLGIPISPTTFVRITMRNSIPGAFGQIYFITNADPTWNEAKHRNFWLYPASEGYKAYDLDMSAVAGWTGTLEMLRVDPQDGFSGGTFSIERVEILTT